MLSCLQKETTKRTHHFVDLLQAKYPDHYPVNTIDAVILRTIIKEYTLRKDTGNLIEYIQNTLKSDLYPRDSVLCNKIIYRLEKEERLLSDCEYLHRVLSCKDQIQSEYFNVFNLNSRVDSQEIDQYDQQYAILKKVFHIEETEKLNLVLDTNLNYWRAFPPWDVKYGLLQRYINGNPHELVHHFFTKYSDVPFFQEPVAFLYGDFKNDTTKFFQKYTALNNQISVSEYVKAKDLWHFPAIVILKESDKLSFWFFTSTLMQKFGVEKFIEFASLTTWNKDSDDFERNFKVVYGLKLEEFEQDHIIGRLAR